MPNPALLLPLGLYFAEPPPEPDLPIEIRTMLEEAMASGNDNDVATIVRYARKAAPKHSQKIAELASHYTFERTDGTRYDETLVMTDGGVYDNLGLAPLLPGRSTRHSPHVYDLDYIMAVDAGRGRGHAGPGPHLLNRPVAH